MYVEDCKRKIHSFLWLRCNGFHIRYQYVLCPLSVQLNVQDQVGLVGDSRVAIELVPPLVGPIGGLLGRNRPQGILRPRQTPLIFGGGREIRLVAAQDDIVGVVPTNQRVVPHIMGTMTRRIPPGRIGGMPSEESPKMASSMPLMVLPSPMRHR